MVKVSVIMPCLNMAKYIKLCLDSVICQTLTDLEILIIDAGSTDGTLNILKEYAEKDPRIRIFHSGKKSYGYQVNLGLSLASGEYIGIVDTDDIIVPEMYEILYQTAIDSNADYVKGTAKGFYTLPDKESYSFSIASFSPTEYDPVIETVPKSTPSLITKDNFLWYGLYKGSLLKKVVLNESPGAAFQDFSALFQIQTRAEKAIYIENLVYFYRQDNIKASTHNHKGFQFIANEYAYAERFLSPLRPEWHKAFYRKQFLHLMDRLYVMAVSGSFWEDALSDIQTIRARLQQAYRKQLLTKEDLTEEQWSDLQLLFKNPRLLFDKYKNFYDLGKKALQSSIQHLHNSTGIIFGRGNWGRFLHAQLLYRGYKNIAAYCDNDVNDLEKHLYGVEIFTPEQAVYKYPKGKYIIANKNHAYEMRQQLIRSGVPEQNIFTYSFRADPCLFTARLCMLPEVEI